MKVNIFLIVIMFYIISFTENFINIVGGGLCWLSNHATAVACLVAEIVAVTLLFRLIFSKKIKENGNKEN